MNQLLPMCNVHHLGMYRDKSSVVPIIYYNKLPPTPDCDKVIVLEPMIATAGTLVAVVDLLKDWGVKDIVILSVLASKEGLKRLVDEHPEVEVWVGHVDEKLSPSGLIVPGLGDVGDRLYCPGNKERLGKDGASPGRALKRPRGE